MSKVKASLEEAREFASTEHALVDNTPPLLPDQGRVAPRGHAVINDANNNNEPVAYSCEQDRMNIGLRENVLSLEHDTVKGALRLKEIFEIAFQNFNDGVLPRHKAVTDYKAMFQWPPVTIGEPREILFSAPEDIKLPLYPIDKVYKSAEKKKDSTRVVAVGTAALEEAAHPIETRLRMYELKDSIRAPNVLLLDETVHGEVTEEVSLKLREMAFTDVFAFLRQELAKRQHDLDHLRDRLDAVGDEKANAGMIDDVTTIEKCSYEELAIVEKMLDKLRDQLNEVFNANIDIETFVEGYESTRDSNEQFFRRLEEENAEYISNINKDIDFIIQKKEDRLAKEAEEVEIHKTFTLDSNAAIQAIHREQTENWNQILELVETNVRLAHEREALVLRHLEEHAMDCQRRAVHDSWLEGCEAYQNKCEQARDVLETTTRWIESLRNFNNRMLDEVEKKNIHEEAFVTRVQEQLEYLETYRQYRTFSDELTHRKEVRANALQRLCRNIDLQIKEAQITLDPNKKRYAEEKIATERDLAEAKAAVQSLLERADREKKYWMPIEEQLDQARVEFDPPDIRADKTKVERKAQTVSRARAFLANEQETVDRDAINLRKLTTTNAIMERNHEKKRLAIKAADDESQAAM